MLCIDTQINDQIRAATKAEREREYRWLSSRVFWESGCDVQSDRLVWKEKNTWFWDLAVSFVFEFCRIGKGSKEKGDDSHVTSLCAFDYIFLWVIDFIYYKSQHVKLVTEVNNVPSMCYSAGRP